MAVYHAFHFGKMNQSFKLEDENNRPLYEAVLQKFRLFTACDYEFSDHVTPSSSMHKVGKTMSVEDRAFGISMSSASYFKLDGKNCFEILEEKGYTLSVIAKLDILHPEFGLVDNNGVRVAVYKMNVSGEKEENVMAVGNKQSNTVITTESNDLEAVFLGAFILSRVDFSLYLIG